MSKRDLGPNADPRKVHIVAWGEVLWDLFPTAAHLGGSSANVAFHAVQLGAKSSLISRVGRDQLGRDAVKQLTEAGVDTHLIGEDPQLATGQVVVSFRSGRPQFDIGAEVAWDQIDVGTRELESLLSCDAFCYSTLAQRSPLARGRLKQVLRRIHQQGSCNPLGASKATRPLCILDLNLRPPFSDQKTICDALVFADIVKLSDEELFWLGKEIGSDKPMQWLFDRFNIKLIILTRGAEGAELYGRSIRVKEPGILVHGGDPVGAGDSFVACFAVGLCQGDTISKALADANSYAAWVASQPGAMPARAS